jgi:hypothetical protein
MNIGVSSPLVAGLRPANGDIGSPAPRAGWEDLVANASWRPASGSWESGNAPEGKSARIGALVPCAASCWRCERSGRRGLLQSLPAAAVGTAAEFLARSAGDEDWRASTAGRPARVQTQRVSLTCAALDIQEAWMSPHCQLLPAQFQRPRPDEALSPDPPKNRAVRRPGAA